MNDDDEGEKVKINNQLYRQFLDTGVMQTLEQADIEKALNNVRGKHTREGRALIIMLYYTGARPAEVLELRPKDISKQGLHLAVALLTKKRGSPRRLLISFKRKWVTELFDFVQKCFPDQLLFWHYKNEYVRYLPDGGIRTETTDLLRYYFKRWFKHLNSIPPYVLRHNRLTMLAQNGATLEEMRWFKGAKSYNSVTPYLHQSTEMGKKLSKKVN